MTAAAPLLRLVAGVLALVLLAAGCSSSEEEPEPSPESSAPAAPTHIHTKGIPGFSAYRWR